MIYSMAAAGLTRALCGTNEQIENVTENWLEHNLGLICDQIAGPRAILCIEQNVKIFRFFSNKKKTRYNFTYIFKELLRNFRTVTSHFEKFGEVY